MRELLVVATSRTHADPDKDARGCWKRGDVVVVQPGGHAWGRKEGLPAFVIIAVPDLPTEREAALVAEELEPDPFLIAPPRRRRRRWHIDLDALPRPFRRALERDGRLEVPWLQLQGIARDRAGQ